MSNAKQFDAICIVDQYGEEVSDLAFISNIGEKTDYASVPHVSGSDSVMGLLNTAHDHDHGNSLVYPDHDDSITLTASASAWSVTGTLVEIIPADTIEDAFDIHWVIVSAISENSEIQIDLYKGEAGSEEFLASIGAVRNAVMSQEGQIKCQTEQLPANTRISARLSSSTANATTANLKLQYHIYD